MASTSTRVMEEAAGLIDEEQHAAAKQGAADVATAAQDFASGKRDAKQEILQSKKRCEDYFEKFKKEPPKGQAAMAFALCMQYCMKPLLCVLVIYFRLCKLIYKVYLLVPINFLGMIFGAGLCFFGGTFYASISAIEGFRQFGGAALWEELAVCWAEGANAEAAVEADAKIDANNDGIVDVQQMTYNEYTTHISKVSMMAVKDPARLTKAMQFLMTTWLAVLAVLKFEFAKTISLCLAVAEMLELPACRVLGPVLAMALGPELNHWCFAIISGTIKIISVIVAVYVQAFISAFYSGLRGSKMFAEGLINMMAKQGLMAKLPVAKDDEGNFDANASYFDECIAYPLAAAGYYWQVTNAFLLPFPYSIILFPLEVIEFFIKWEIYTS